MLGEKPAVPRISDLGHLYASSLGKLELDLMGSHQMSERQVLDAIIAEAIRIVFEEYVDKHGLDEIAEIFGKGVKIEVGDMLPSATLRRAAEARAAGLGQGVRGQRLAASPPSAPPASNSSWPASMRWKKSAAAQQHGRMVYEVG